MTDVHDDFADGVAVLVDEVDVLAVADVPARLCELFVDEDTCLLFR